MSAGGDLALHVPRGDTGAWRDDPRDRPL